MGLPFASVVGRWGVPTANPDNAIPIIRDDESGPRLQTPYIFDVVELCLSGLATGLGLVWFPVSGFRSPVFRSALCAVRFALLSLYVCLGYRT